MKVTVTITGELDDSMWRFSELLEGVSKGREQMAMDLIKEDVGAVLDAATWEIRIEDDPVTTFASSTNVEEEDIIYHEMKYDNGKIVEHWDSIQEVPNATKNGNSMY